MTPGEVIKAGVSVIYQEFNLVPEMSVYENIFMGKEYTRRGAVDHKRGDRGGKAVYGPGRAGCGIPEPWYLS